MFKLKSRAMLLALACGTLLSAHANAAEPPHAELVELFTKALPDYPGKEALLLEVEYPPGAVDPVHTHDAHSFVYVLEGSIVMAVKGGREVTLKRGETFYESPNDVHTVGRNASKTERARFVVLLLKKQGAAILTPVQSSASP